MLLIQNADLTNMWMHAQSIMESGQCVHCFIVLIQPQFIYSFRMDLLENILIIKTNFVVWFEISWHIPHWKLSAAILSCHLTLCEWEYCANF